MEIKPADLGMVQDGARIKAVLPILEEEIEALKAGVETRALIALSKGELTPELAVSLWVERLELSKLLRRFRQKATIGEAMGQEIGPELTRQLTEALTSAQK